MVQSRLESSGPRRSLFRQRLEDDVLTELLAAECELMHAPPEDNAAARRRFLRALGLFNSFALDDEVLEPAETASDYDS